MGGREGENSQSGLAPLPSKQSCGCLCFALHTHAFASRIHLAVCGVVGGSTRGGRGRRRARVFSVFCMQRNKTRPYQGLKGNEKEREPNWGLKFVERLPTKKSAFQGRPTAAGAGTRAATPLATNKELASCRGPASASPARTLFVSACVR